MEKDPTNTEIKEFNRKYERNENTPRLDLRKYVIPSDESNDSASEKMDRKMRKLDASFMPKCVFLSKLLAFRSNN